MKRKWARCSVRKIHEIKRYYSQIAHRKKLACARLQNMQPLFFSDLTFPLPIFEEDKLKDDYKTPEIGTLCIDTKNQSVTILTSYCNGKEIWEALKTQGPK